MAFACTASKFYFTETSKAVNMVDNLQFAEITITAANTDLTWDVGDLAGTAWGVMDGTATGLSTLNALKDIKLGLQKIVSVTSAFMLDRAEVVSADAAGNYAKSYTAGDVMPSFAFHTASGPTSDTIVLCWKMKPGQLGITAEYTA